MHILREVETNWQKIKKNSIIIEFNCSRPNPVRILKYSLTSLWFVNSIFCSPFFSVNAPVLRSICEVICDCHPVDSFQLLLIYPPLSPQQTINFKQTNKKKFLTSYWLFSLKTNLFAVRWCNRGQSSKNWCNGACINRQSIRIEIEN